MNTAATHNEDEASLVEYCKDNNPAAQKKLYNKYVECIMILCLRYVLNSEDAKEVMLDSFLKFFSNINTFIYHGDGSVRAWLKKIAVNQCLSHLRKRRSLLVYSDDLASVDDASSMESALDSMNTKEIMKLVHSLPDGYRTVFNLYVFEGMSHTEIGELLGISDNTSKSQLHKARAILKKQILQTNITGHGN